MSLGLAADSDARAKKFFAEAQTDGRVFYLRGTKGPLLLESTEGKGDVIPFWSRAYIPYAKKLAPKGFTVTELTLASFIADWLAGMKRDGVLVGLNWDQNGVGSENAPDVVAQTLSRPRTS